MRILCWRQFHKTHRLLVPDNSRPCLWMDCNWSPDRQLLGIHDGRSLRLCIRCLLDGFLLCADYHYDCRLRRRSRQHPIGVHILHVYPTSWSDLLLTDYGYNQFNVCRRFQLRYSDQSKDEYGWHVDAQTWVFKQAGPHSHGAIQRYQEKHPRRSCTWFQLD